jgi:hypothetical protein
MDMLFYMDEICRHNMIPFKLPDATTFETAAKFGNMHSLYFFTEDLRRRWDVRTMMTAAYYGQVDILEFAFENDCPFDLKKMDSFENYQRWSPMTMAGYSGEDYFGNNYDEFWNFWEEDRPISLGELSAANGNVFCLYALYQYQSNISSSEERRVYCDFNTTTFTAAVSNGHLQCLDILLDWWAHDESDRDLDEMSLVVAASKGDLDLLQKLQRINVFPWNGLACIASISANHLGCLEFALRHTILVGLNRREAYCLAIRLNQLECIQLLHEWTDETEEDEWDEWFCQDAAAYNHLSILKFLHHNGYPWNHLTLLSALEQGNIECVKYADEHECPRSAQVNELAYKIGYVWCKTGTC